MKLFLGEVGMVAFVCQIVDSVLIWENTGQQKPIFLHTQSSAITTISDIIHYHKNLFDLWVPWITNDVFSGVFIVNFEQIFADWVM